jgi:hypothetical protein
MKERPDVPGPQVVYGTTVYWLCIAAALICTIGLALAIVFPSSNLLDPHYLFYAIWQGNSPEKIWEEMSQRFPGAHFWIGRLGQPDALIQLGLVIGCSCSGVALLAAALAFLREKPLQIGWTLVAALIVIQILLSLLGVYHP